MYCMKCGKETQQDQVFCESCLQVMDAYPVKPDAAIQLPIRAQRTPSKKSAHRKRKIPLEEQVANLKKANRRLRLTVFVLGLIAAIFIGVGVYQLTVPKDADNSATNQNYTYAPDSGNAD